MHDERRAGSTSTQSTQAEGFTPTQREAWERLVRAVRGVIDQAVQIDAPAEQIDAAVRQLEALSSELSPFTGSRPVARFQLPFDRQAPSDHFAYSPISGKLNPVAPPVRFSVEGDRVIGRVTFGPAYEGGVGLVHGGVIAMVWDEVLAIANLINGAGGPTGELSVRFVAATPAGRELRFEAWHERRDGRRILAKGRCYADDIVVTEAEGLYIALSANRPPDSAWGVNTQSAGLRPETPAHRRPT